ncbi:Holliday junction DNA helicase subunit RuvA [Marinospirillum celere]|uniref:Holliday junction branch migration complex subunit RuvA n=1 Tax=Marinospirillum celere TaxID=1122252 RepID=A0A1I1ESV5_9GAMM|nr:Holliday junction branch migration protein RuvA [Marinospirillum celere]SFB90161.1 Holliday junction DNA helicase subunit RuvA [Marinospirillum celere]
MIGRLQGVLAEKQPSWVILDVQGVGYEVDLPLSVFAGLPALNEPLTLWIHQVIREDANLLYGFARLEDRQLFRELIKVSGIGPKVALAILSSLESRQLLTVIQEGDLQSLTRVPGIGKKTAERLLVDLKDRLKSWQPQQMAKLELPMDAQQPKTDHRAEAEAALIALGYKPTEASRALSGIDPEGKDTQALIKAALQSVSR